MVYDDDLNAIAVDSGNCHNTPKVMLVLLDAVNRLRLKRWPPPAEPTPPAPTKPEPEQLELFPQEE